MSLYDVFETNKQAEQDGVILDYGPNSAGKPIQIRIARAGGSNARFAKVLEHKTRPHKRAIANEILDQKVAERLMIETFAETVVLGWENVEDRDGKLMEFNKENVIKLFTDLPDLFKDIQEQSQKSALFREQVRQADAGNSPRS